MIVREKPKRTDINIVSFIFHQEMHDRSFFPCRASIGQREEAGSGLSKSSLLYYIISAHMTPDSTFYPHTVPASSPQACRSRDFAAKARGG